MKQIRIITCIVSRFSKTWENLGLMIDEIPVELHDVSKSEKGHCLYLIATQKLAFRPKVTEEGVIVVDSKRRERAERALHSFADIIAVLAQSPRAVASPRPCFAFQPEDEAERAFLEQSAGIQRLGAGFPGVGIEFPWDVLMHLGDRLDGFSLMAEAISSGHPLGKFNELYRLFERAFSKTSQRLLGPLHAFLWDEFGYTQAEIKRWLQLRDRARHADVRKKFACGYDVLPVMQRVEQAAYDVLLNKKEWHRPSSSRRAVWRPKMGTASAEGSLFSYGAPKGRMNLQVLDDFGVFPLNLEAKPTIPPAWFTKMQEQKPIGNDNASRISMAEFEAAGKRFKVDLVIPKGNESD